MKTTQKDPAVVLEKLESYFEPSRNILYERFLFHAAEQQPNETVDQYIIRLGRLAETCNFQTLHDEMLRDRLVLGCKDKAARARLFRQKECDLKTALEALRISERTHEQLKQLATEEQEKTPVHALRMDPQSNDASPRRNTIPTRGDPTTTGSRIMSTRPGSTDTAGTPTKLTRAGRTVKIPERYKDFVKL